MQSREGEDTGRVAPVVLYAVLFLFFLQLLSEFIESVYAFGLASTGMVAEILAIVLILSPALLLCFRKGLSGRACIIAGEMMLLARVLEPLLDTRSKMHAAGIGVGCFLVLFPSLLLRSSHREEHTSPQALPGGIALAIALSMLCRALGSGLDITMWRHGQPAGWVLVAVAGVLLPRHINPGGQRDCRSNAARPGAGSSNLGQTIACALGMMASLVLMYFVVSTPNVVARWTAADYRAVVGGMALSLTGLAFLMTSERTLTALARPKILVLCNALFVLSMTATIWAHQVDLPDAVATYPVEAPPVTPLHRLLLAAMLVSCPVILLDFIVCARRVTALRPPDRAIAAGFTIGSAYLLLMIFAHIFTTVYDYIPGIGPWFRDRFWCVHLAGGFILAVATLWAVKTTGDLKPVILPRASRRGWPAAVALAGAGAIIVSIWTTPNPPAPPDSGTLRVLSYNIQQGYSADAEKNFDGQLELIRGVDPDLIGLSESDTNRIAGGNADVVRFFADKLNLHSYYGPSPVTGTFGVALLSKYPIRNPRTWFLFSHAPGRRQKEQTAVILAEVEVGQRVFTIGVTHLGNSGPVYQQEEILGLLAGSDNAVLMGDFNFRPSSESYSLTTQSLVDSWAANRDSAREAAEVDPNGRIDHIFTSPEIRILDSRYLTAPESDHPALFTEIER